MFLNKRDSVTKFTLDEIRHDLLLNFSQETMFEGTGRSFKPVSIQLPYPVSKPGEPTEDVVLKVVEEKQAYQEEFEKKAKRYKRYDKKSIHRTTVAGQKYVYLPRHLLEFYQWKDQDKHFNCDYNYYYTGGALEQVTVNGGRFLVHPGPKDGLNLLNLNGHDIIQLNFETTSPIHSINSSSNLLAVREKSKVSIIGIDPFYSCDLHYVEEYEVPILDAKLHDDTPTRLGVVLCNGTLKIMDTDKNKAVFTHQNQSSDQDSFQQFKFYDTNSLVVLNTFKMKVFDCRSKREQYCFSPDLIKCNPLCNFDLLDSDLFMASRHYVMKADIRNLKDFVHYSHSLNQPPTFMNLTRDLGDTYLIVGSYKPDNTVLFTGKSPHSLPYKVPSVLATLKKCLVNDPKLTFFKDLEHRLRYSLIGMKIVNIKEEIYIYTINCLGELFRQQVSNVVDNDAPVEILTKWLKTIEQPQPVLNLTFAEEMSNARFTLSRSNITQRCLLDYTKVNDGEEFLAKYGPRFQSSNVHSNLAKDFLAIWEGSDDDDEEKEEIVDKLPEVPVNDKVEEWIKSFKFSDHED